MSSVLFSLMYMFLNHALLILDLSLAKSENLQVAGDKLAKFANRVGTHRVILFN